jgi:hypothetical protein
MTEEQMLVANSFEKWKRNMCMLISLLSYQFLSDTKGLNINERILGGLDISVKNYG